MTSIGKPLMGRSGMSAVTALLLLVAVGAAVVAVLAPAYQLTQSGGYVTALRADAPAGVREYLTDGVRVVSSGEQVTLAVDEMPAGLRVLSELATSVAALAVAGGAWALAMVLRSIQAGRPFDRRNPLRLAGLAGAVVVAGTTAPFLGGVLNDVVVQAVDPYRPGAPLNTVVFQLPLLPLLVALVVLAVAEAFRRGRALADDVVGLV